MKIKYPDAQVDTYPGNSPFARQTANSSIAAVPLDSNSAREPPKLMDRQAVQAFFGGSRPLNHVTLYRGIKSGIFPKPIKIGKTMVRWLRSECEDALRAMIAARDN